MCHKVHPNTDMNMGKVRSSIMSRFNIPEHEACHISNKDSHFFCAIQRLHATSPSITLTPLFSQTLDLSTSARRLTRCPCTSVPCLRAPWKTLIEVACEDCLLSECRLLPFLYQSCHSYLPPFSFFVDFFSNVQSFAVLLPAYAI
jgi:hypothetical protein